MKIRLATLKDINGIMALQKEQVHYHSQLDPQYYAVDYNKKYPLSRDRGSFQVEIKPRPPRLIVADNNRTIVGFVNFGSSRHSVEDSKMKPQGEIVSTIVSPSYRRQGVAQKLMATAERYLRRQGFKFVSLLVSSFNTPAINLYQKLGYVDRQHLMFKKL